MRDELYESLWRYDAMTGLVDWKCEDDPGREERDREAYGKEYGLLQYPGGMESVCYARIVRFLVEVCGHSYEESLAALIEHVRGQPSALRSDLDADCDARNIRVHNGNIIEALFSLKVGRLIDDEAFALDYNWKVTRRLMSLPGPKRLS